MSEVFVSSDARYACSCGVIRSTMEACPRGTGSDSVEGNGHFFLLMPSALSFVFLLHTHIHAHTRTHMRARTHTHTHTHVHARNLRHSLIYFLICGRFSHFDDCTCWCCIDNFPAKSSSDNDVDCGSCAHNHLQSTCLPIVSASASTHLTVA